MFGFGRLGTAYRQSGTMWHDRKGSRYRNGETPAERGVELGLRILKTIAVALSAAAVSIALGCGDGEDEGPAETDGLLASIRIEASDNVYDVQPAASEPGRIEAPANAEFEVTLVNAGVNPHDIDFYDVEGGSLLSEAANGEIIVSGEEETFTFMTPGPGTYYFVCSVHPTEMFGDFVAE
jgi:plastocyanin